MATFVNDLRLTELATGEGSGTWGTTTNTNLELIAESFSFGTEAITTNADTHTTTIADGSTDPGRSLFLKYTGTLDSACTITIGPNTVSKLWLIENATSGSQNIIIKQGSGSTITIPNGQTKAIYSDGAGSGGAMVDAFQDLSIPDLFIDDDLTIGDDLTFTSDSAVITFGADGDTTITHTDGSGLTLNSTNKLMFNDASQFIQGSSATVLSLGATDEIDLTATAIDINGTADISSTLTVGGATRINADFSVSAASGEDRFAILPQSAGSGTILFSGNSDLSAYEPLVVDFENLNLRTSGTARFTITATDTVINDNSNDHDFRVESNGNTHALFVDAANDVVLIGKSAVSGSTVGIQAKTAGELSVVRDGNHTLILNRKSSDGDVALFQKDGSTVGSISSTDNAGIIIGSQDVGLRFRQQSAGGAVFPRQPDGSALDNTMDLGISNSRFKDLHLSGSIVNSSDITLDSAGDIILDADGGDVNFKDAGTEYLRITNAVSGPEIFSPSNDGDLFLKGVDGGSTITALTLDMSAAGEATFNAGIKLGDGHAATFGAGGDLLVYHSSDENIIQTNTSDQDLLFKGNDGGSTITALTLDMSAAGAASFNSSVSGTSLIATEGLLELDDNGTHNGVINVPASCRINIDSDNNSTGESFQVGSNATNISGSNILFKIEEDGTATFSGNVKASDILASGSGGLALQTDDGVKRITLEDSGTITLGGNSIAAATTVNTRRSTATGDILRITGGNSNVSEFAAILIHGENVTGGTQKGIITFNTIDVAAVGDATLQERVRVTAEGPTRFVSGSSTVPGITFLNDTNTGFNNASADNIGFVVGGSQKAFLSASQFNVTGNGVFSGSISKGSGSFKIDHPLPSKTDTHHLVHSFVEAPQADNIYRGSVDLVGGSATVNIDTAAGMTDGTFVLLNTNIQCFTSNESGWTAIKGSVSGNTLTITAQDSDCTDTISWMVVGERHDQHMKDTEWTDSDGKVIVEPEKASEGE